MIRIKELDGLRGIAICSVVLWHYVAYQVPVESSQLLALVVRSLSIAWSGVDLFFVLSGFLIVGVLLDAKGSASFFRSFYIRRAFRILPLYYVMLLLFWILPQLLNAESPWLFALPWPVWSYWTFTQNIFMHEQGFGPQWLGVTWSLAIEEQFYLVIPLMVRWLRPRWLVVVLCLGVVAAPGLRAMIGNLGAYVFPHTRADAIFVGALIAVAFRQRNIWSAISTHRRELLLLTSLGWLGVVFLMTKRAGVGDVYLHTCLALADGGLLVLILMNAWPSLNRAMKSPVLVWLGLRSYGIFLFHQPVIGLLRLVVSKEPVPALASWADVGLTSVALLITLILSHYSFRLFEIKAINFGRRLLR